ncbi:DUF3800 domain-containing protein [Candidatus Daviesbacteria bacterium]|nr:DUF3800 domain-containing protein [Candidatus Daviesbacteria bacterium]
MLSLSGANVGDSTGDSSFGSVGGSIYAGNIFSAGALEVSGNSQFWNGAGFMGAVNIGVGATFPSGSPVFSVTSANSTAALGSAFTVMGNGNVGVGTTSPIGALHVVGQCVTGDTKLRRRKRKKNGELTDEWEEVPIKDIRSGDEILTLDESTGEFVTSKVNALMDMGTKTTFKLTTGNGKTIRTTSEHPYLTKLVPANDGLDFAFVDEVGVSYSPDQPLFGIGALVINDTLAINRQLHDILTGALSYYKKNSKKPGRFEFKFNLIKKRNVHFFKKILDVLNKHNWNFWYVLEDKPFIHEDLPANYIWERYNIQLKRIAANFTKPTAIAADYFDEPNTALAKLSDVAQITNVQNIMQSESHGSLLLQVVDILVGAVNFRAKFELSPNLPRHKEKKEISDLVMKMLEDKKMRGYKLSSCLSTMNITTGDGPCQEENNLITQIKTKWIKIKELKEGMEIAVVDSSGHVKWEKIAKIEKMGREQVFDIEVEGTHNFVGNDIVAHNTYINGNLGIGQSAPDRKLTLSNDLDLTSSLASLLGVNGTQFSVTGGTSNPTKKLVLGIDTTDNYGVIQAGISTGTAYNLSLNPAGGNVGIGATTANSALYVNGGATIGSSFNAATAPTDGLLVQGNVGLGTNSTTAPVTINYGTFLTATGMQILNNSSSFIKITDTSTGTFRAAWDRLNLSFNGNDIDATGATIIGVEGGVRLFTTSTGGTFGKAIGVKGAIENTFSGGYTITNGYALYAANPAGSGTITNNYGLYIENQTAGTNDYGVYVAGADTAAAYFGGNVGIGFSSPVALFQVGSVNTDNPQGFFVANNLNKGIGSSYNVGIGTSNPRALLEVNGGFFMSGGSGDVQGDGDVDSTDALCISRYIRGLGGTAACPDLTSDVTAYSRADVDGDGLITQADTEIISALGAGYSKANLRRAVASAISINLGSVSDDVNQTSVGIGTLNQNIGSKLNVAGNVGIGWSFMTGATPTDGLAVHGNVGIGTTTTGAKLHVIGDAIVSGNITVASCSGCGVADDYISVTSDETSNASSAEFDVFEDANYPGGTIQYTTNASSGITYTASTGVFDIATTGKYLITFNALVIAAGSPDTVDYVIKKNSVALYDKTFGVHSSVDPVERSISIIASLTAGDDIEFFIDNTTANNSQASNGTSASIIPISGGADIAEIYHSNEELTHGELVAIDPTLKAGVKKSIKPYEKEILGIVSTQPGVVLSNSNDSEGNNQTVVALAGRVPLKVSTENGSIQAGDYLTSSSIPGVAMKATRPGPTVGKALESFYNEDYTVIGKITAFINISWYDPDAFRNNLSDISINLLDGTSFNAIPNKPYTVSSSLSNNPISKVGVFDQLALGTLTAGGISADSLSINHVTFQGQDLQTILSSKVSSDSFEVKNATSSATVNMADVVSVDENGQTKPAEMAYDINILGVGSSSQGNIILSGKALVKVSTENGPIQAGDYLTSSSTPGVAMKALRPGPTVGKALEPFDGSGSQLVGDSLVSNNDEPTNQLTNNQFGKILAFVNVSYADPGNFFASLSFDNQGNLIIPKIKVGSLQLDPSLATASASLRASEGSVAIYTDPAYTNPGPNLATNSNTSVDLSGKLASFEDRIAALEDSIKYQLVSIKGEATESAEIAGEATDSADLASELDSLDLTDPEILLATDSASFIADLNTYSDATISGVLTAYQIEAQDSLKVFGETTLAKTSVAGDLTVDGTFSIETGNTISVIGTLYLQKSLLAQSLDIFNGKVVIDKEGVIKATTVVADQIKVREGKSAGVGTILAGQTEVVIENFYAESSALILITPNTPLAQTLAVTDKLAGSFKVRLSSPETVNITFDYLIVSQEKKLVSN